MPQPTSHAQDFINPYQGIYRATNWVSFINAFKTILGPVPKGHVFLVHAVHVQGDSSGTRIIEGRQVEDGGSGFVFTWDLRVLGGAVAEQYPRIEGNASLALTYRYRDFVMEKDDVYQMRTTLAPDPFYRCRVEYWDVSQQ